MKDILHHDGISHLYFEKGIWIFWLGIDIFFSNPYICHNPTLAKCGGEAQHLGKVKV